MRLKVFFLLVLVTFVYSIYEDEIGVYDWNQQNLGKVTKAEFSSSGVVVFTISQEGVVSSLSCTTGEIAWRQILPNDEIPSTLTLLDNEKYLLTITEGGHRAYLWRSNDGSLIWDQELYGHDDFDSSDDSILSSVLLGDELAILSHYQLYLLSFTSGTILWNAVKSPEGLVSGIALYNNEIHVSVVHSDNSVTIHNWDTESGGFQKIATHHFDNNNNNNNNNSGNSIKTKSMDNTIIFTSSKEICLMISSTSIIECHPLENIIGNGIKELDVVRNIKNDKKLFVITWMNDESSIYFYDGKAVSIVQSSLNDYLRFIPGKSYNFLAQLPKKDEKMIQIITSESKTENNMIQLPYNYESQGSIQSIFNNPKRTGEYLIVCEDHSLSMVDEQSQSVIWKREESLGSINIARFVDIPGNSLDEEVLHSHGIIKQFTKRVITQFEQVRQFILSEFQEQEANFLEKDRFGFNKLLMLASSSGKLLCLSNHPSHPVVWSLWLPNETIEDMFLTKFASTDNSLFMVITKNNQNNLSNVYTLNPFNGDLISSENLDYTITHSLLFPQKDLNGQHILLAVDSNQIAHVFPSSDEAQSIAALLISSTFDFNVNTDNGEIYGYELNENSIQNFSLEEHWRLSFTKKERIIAMERLSDSHIYSAIVLMQQDVAIPKYINRNLVAIGTITEIDDIESINIYLVDIITGMVIHHTYHSNSAGPLNMVLCENFLVYSYWNKKSYRTEVSVIELYETTIDWDSTSFSSYEGITPIVYQQTFEVNFPVSTLGITQTRRGITTHNILFGTTGGQLLAIDKRWINPFRPIEGKGATGVMGYSPELRLYSRSFVSHNVQVGKLKNIISTSAHLESTSLVFTWGLDQFFTHVRPADKFDMLDSDFDKVSLLGTVVFLLIITIISHSLHKKRKLAKQWK